MSIYHLSVIYTHIATARRIELEEAEFGGGERKKKRRTKRGSNAGICGSALLRLWMCACVDEYVGG